MGSPELCESYEVCTAEVRQFLAPMWTATEALPTAIRPHMHAVHGFGRIIRSPEHLGAANARNHPDERRRLGRRYGLVVRDVRLLLGGRVPLHLVGVLQGDGGPRRVVTAASTCGWPAPGKGVPEGRPQRAVQLLAADQPQILRDPLT
jgi:hypothetical protein